MSNFLVKYNNGRVKLLSSVEQVRDIFDARPETVVYLIKDTKKGLTLKPVTQNGKVQQRTVSVPVLVAEGNKL